MTLADYARFALLIALGVLSVIVFLVAGTLVGLMFVDPYGCQCVIRSRPSAFTCWVCSASCC